MNGPLAGTRSASVALCGFAPDLSARSRIDEAARIGARGVAVDGGAAGMRARELDRSARRGVAAVLRRLELRFSGVDLWIPPGHFGDPAHADRAASAAIGAIDLARELSDLVEGAALVSLELPEGGGEAVRALADHASRRDVGIADHGRGAPAIEHPAVGAGYDLARGYDRGDDPATALAAWGDRLLALRLTDGASGGRVTLGQGRVDVAGARAAAATIAPGAEPIVDVRGLRETVASAEAALAVWAGGSTV